MKRETDLEVKSVAFDPADGSATLELFDRYVGVIGGPGAIERCEMKLKHSTGVQAAAGKLYHVTLEEVEP